MALIGRIARLFRADVHAVLDRVEEPGTLLRQAVREMEAAQVLDERRFRVWSREQVQLDARKAELEQYLAQTREELDVCFAADNDDLARTLIKRKLETRRHLKLLDGRRESLAQKTADLGRRLDENRTRLDGMRQKVELLNEENASAAPEAQWCVPDFSIGEADVEVALLHEKQRRRQS